MGLTKLIPLLFGVPSVRMANLSIAVSVGVMGLAVIGYLLTGVWGNFPFFHFLVVLLAVHGVFALISVGLNLLYLFRYMLVWVLIFVTACVWGANNGEILVAPFGAQFQTAENTRTLLLAGVFSLSGSLIGWQLSLRRFHLCHVPAFDLSLYDVRRFRALGYVLAFGFVSLYIVNNGGIVGGGKVYADGVGGLGLKFGVYNIFQFTGVALILLSGVSSAGLRRRYVYLVVLCLLLGVLTGSRADFLPQAFLISLLLFNSKVSRWLIEKRYLLLLRYIAIAVFMVILGYLTASFIAVWRTGLNPVDVLADMWMEKKVIPLMSIGGHKVFWLETGNMMLGSLYSAIVQVVDGYTGFLYGQSYFNYVLVTPPAFIGLPRPLGLEWMTGINGQVMTQGGVFEVAEAFWNFGFIGCFFVSFFLSYYFAWLLRRGLLRGNYFFIVFYIVFGLHGFRSIWYQNFSYFRLLTVMLFFWGVAFVFFRWLIRDRQS